jgi:hypothetical protein
MEFHLSNEAWITIGCIAGMLVILNIGLLGALLRRGHKNSQRSPANFKPSFREPWQAEERNMQELSKLVNELEDKRSSSSPADPGKNRTDPQ